MSAALPSSAGGRTREKILICAEQLFAEHGIDAVTLRQIARISDQSNVSAVQYHFGGKDQLLDAILDRHTAVIDEHRRKLLDDQEQAGTMHDLLGLMRVLVEPVAAELDYPSGCAYLQIQSQQFRKRKLRSATRLMTARISQALGWPMGESDPMADRLAALLLFVSLADRAREEAAEKSSVENRERFIDGLMRALLAIFQTFRPEPESAPAVTRNETADPR